MDFLSLLGRGEPPATTLAQAQEILGEKNVFGVDRVESVWGESRLQNPTIPYSLSTLRAKASENKKENRMWTLVYAIGLSLIRQREKRGTDPTQMPCFMETGIWNDLDYAALLGEAGSSGYRLVDLSLPYTNLTFDKQKEEIDKNSKHQRVSARAVSEIILSVFMISGSCPLLLRHHTAALTRDGDVVRLVYVPLLGLSLFTCPDMARSDSGVVICQMYDIAPRK